MANQSVTYKNRDTGEAFIITITDKERISVENLLGNWKIILEFYDSKSKLAYVLSNYGVTPEDIQNILALIPQELLNENKRYIPKELREPEPEESQESKYAE